MFKKFKDRLTEVSEEVKQNPRFQNSLASVNQIAEKTYSVIKNEATTTSGPEQEEEVEDEAISFSELQAAISGHDHDDDTTVMNNNFFSLTEEDDDPLPGPSTTGPGRSRRSSQNSQDGAGGSNLFPIYESPPPRFTLPSNDLDSTAGSEWESDLERPGSSASTHLTSISKEQLFQTLQKNRVRYHKYKGRYADVAKAYQDLEIENDKVKKVMQQTQDKALRRISELKEQCQLEEKAKRHLEEELRGDLEEKEHVIKALQTKVVLLKSGGVHLLEENAEHQDDLSGAGGGSSAGTGDPLSDLNASSGVIKRDSEKVVVLEDKVRRLEALLTKCKESIKANKQKTTALTEVKDSLASQLSEKETELASVTSKLDKVTNELQSFQKKEQDEELQIAEIKMQMHQELITKDEEIGRLRTKLKHATDDNGTHQETIKTLKEEVDHLKVSKDVMEKKAQNEKALALQGLQGDMEKKMDDLKIEHSKKLEAAKAELQAEHKKNIAALEKDKIRELKLKGEEALAKIAEKDEETKLASEELELRVKALTKSDEGKTSLISELEAKIQSLSAEKQKLTEQIKSLQVIGESSVDEVKSKLAIAEKTIAELSQSLEANEIVIADLKSRSVKVASLEDEVDVMKKELEKSASNHEAAKAELMAKNEKEEKAKVALEESEHRVKALTKSEEDKMLRISDLETKLAKASEEIQKLTDKTKSLQESGESSIDELRSMLANVESSNSELSQSLAAKEKEIADLKIKTDKVGTLETEVETLKEALEKSASEHESSKADSAKMILEIESFNQSLEDAKKTEVELKAKLADLEQSVEDALVEKERLQRDLKDKEAMLEQNGNEMSSELMKLQEKHNSLEQERDQLAQKEKFLSAKCEESKEELSKITGTNSQLQKKLEAEADRCAKLLETVQGLTAQLDSVKSEKTQLEEREKSMKVLEEQMISYEKELQEKIRQSEEKEAFQSNEIERLNVRISQLGEELEISRCSHQEEMCKMKSDMELKIRNEREVKEASFKELQVQSIEYQKRLQEQIQTLENQLEAERDNLCKSLESERSWKSKMDDLAKANEELRAQLEAAKSGQESDDQTLRSIRSELEKSSQDHLKQVQAMVSDHKVEIQELERNFVNEKAVMTRDHENLERQVDSLKSKISESEDQLSAKEKELAEQIASYEDLQAEVENARKELQREIDELKEEKRELEEMEGQHHKDFGSQLEDLQTANELLQKELEEVKQSLFQSHQLFDAKTAECEEANSQLNEVNEIAENLRKDLSMSHEDKANQLTEFEESLDDLERQLKEYKAKNDILQDQLDKIDSANAAKWSEKLRVERESLESAHREKMEVLLREHEVGMRDAQDQHEEQVMELKRKSEMEIRSLSEDLKQQNLELKRQLLEKTAIVEEIVERHGAELRAKQNEMDQEIQACSKIYSTKIEEMQRNMDEEKRRRRKSSSAHDATSCGWDVEDFEELDEEEGVEGQSWNEQRSAITDAPEDFQRTPRHGPAPKSSPEALANNHHDTAAVAAPARLSVSESNHVNSVQMPTYKLEEATEFEYLRNILFEYMMGKEPLTLARVLTTVVKFSPEQTASIIAHEEKKQTTLGGLLGS